MDINYFFALGFFLAGCGGVWLLSKMRKRSRLTHIVRYWDRAKGQWIEFGKDY